MENVIKEQPEVQNTGKQKKGTAKKILFGLFLLSFLPAVWLLCYATYSAIFGYDVYTLILPEYVRTDYGLEAFLSVVTWYGIALCVTMILPGCVIYQAVYLITSFMKKKKQTIKKAEMGGRNDH